MAKRPRKKRNDEAKKPSLSTVNYERAADLSDSMYQVLVTESKYSVYNNQQLAMAFGMLLNRIKQKRSREAWVYIRAIVMAEMEDPFPELMISEPLTNKLSKPNEKNKKSGRKATKDGSDITSEEKKTP